MAIYIWVLIFLFYCIHTVINYKNNAIGGIWFWYAWGISIIPIFPLMVRFSKNLLWDGLLFELMMLLSYVTTLIVLGSAKGFNSLQWLGLILTILGFVLMKARM